MNIICSTVEAVTATTQLIGTSIGTLSVIWSWASGLLHCAEGTIMNPIISTVCGPIVGGGCGTIVGGGGGGICGTILGSLCGGLGLSGINDIIHGFAEVLIGGIAEAFGK